MSNLYHGTLFGFQLQIPRDQRQYLGNWMTESTADVYTRRNGIDLGEATPQCRADLDHPDWAHKPTAEIDLGHSEKTGSAGSWQNIGSHRRSHGSTLMQKRPRLPGAEFPPTPKRLFHSPLTRAYLLHYLVNPQGGCDKGSSADQGLLQEDSKMSGGSTKLGPMARRAPSYIGGA